ESMRHSWRACSRRRAVATRAAPPSRAARAWQERSRPTATGAGRWALGGSSSLASCRPSPRQVPRPAPIGQRPAPLPLDGSLLRRIDVLFRARLEEERLHVLLEKAAGLRVHDVQAVMIDEHRLLLEPLAPAVLADLLNDALPNFAGKRWTLEAGLLLAAAGASDFHVGLRVNRNLRAG